MAALSVSVLQDSPYSSPPKGGEEYQGVNLSFGCLKGFYFVSLSIVITCSAGAEGPQNGGWLGAKIFSHHQ